MTMFSADVNNRDELLKRYNRMIKPIPHDEDSFILSQYYAKNRAENMQKENFKETLDNSYEDVLQSEYEVESGKYRCPSGILLNTEAHDLYLATRYSKRL